ncbi:hypothetical protein RhiirC2_802407 [Rhizophagus irregularis]|uniref:Uncharacterized protein n=1 Tax=Rhizophagus irregularis TaxID=588596 RepID=A0A2N1M1F5_9GLOM|nr:hypothetical protein RhiirC2_802407 [Rhizophagus irregularis]
MLQNSSRKKIPDAILNLYTSKLKETTTPLSALPTPRQLSREFTQPVSAMTQNAMMSRSFHNAHLKCVSG